MDHLGESISYLAEAAEARDVYLRTLSAIHERGVQGNVSLKLSQFGIDLYITRKLSAFGTGRFDLVQGSSNRVQSKVYLGLRGRF